MLKNKRAFLGRASLEKNLGRKLNKSLGKKMNKRGQVTLFIILAILIVAIIIILFLLWNKPATTSSPTTDPQAYIQKCMKDATKEAVETILENGGNIAPGNLLYQGKNLTYLCYNANFYAPCINQRPLLIEHIESEITNFITPEIKDCFASLKAELEKRNYEVETGSMKIDTALESKRITINVSGKFTMTKNKEAKTFNEFKVQLASPLYELAKIAIEIVNQEARYCNFENLGFMIIYPQYDIRKMKIEDSNMIYTIKDIPTGKQFKFAVRSCALPAGL